jgi:hypothetical protein
MVIYFAGLNLLDQVRENAEYPNQLLYIPADCRIYWTFKNYNNYTRLWHDVWSAIYQDTSLCIGHPPNTTEAQKRTQPVLVQRYTEDVSDESINPFVLEALGLIASPGVEDSTHFTTAVNFPPLCATGGKRDQKKCPDGTVCTEVTNQCGEPCEKSQGLDQCTGKQPLSEWRCLRGCTNGLKRCGSSTSCGRLERQDGGINASGSKGAGHTVQSPAYSGYCVPQWTDWRTTSCKALRRQWDYYDRASSG